MTTLRSLSRGNSLAILAVCLGCLAVLWPKVFQPMLLGSPDISKNIKTTEEFPNRQETPLGYMHPGMRETSGRPTFQRPNNMAEDIRSSPVPGMRPNFGAPIRDHAPAGRPQGSIGVLMPIYTLGIVIFFVYTTMKIMFKRQNNNEDCVDTIEQRYDSNFERRYYNRLTESDRYIDHYAEELKRNFHQLPSAERNELIQNYPYQDYRQPSQPPPVTQQEIKWPPLSCHQCATTQSENTSLPASESQSPPDIIENEFVDSPANNEDDRAAYSIKEEEGIPETTAKNEQELDSGNQLNAPDVAESKIDPRDYEICLLRQRLHETEQAMERIISMMDKIGVDLHREN